MITEWVLILLINQGYGVETVQVNTNEAACKHFLKSKIKEVTSINEAFCINVNTGVTIYLKED